MVTKRILRKRSENDEYKHLITKISTYNKDLYTVENGFENDFTSKINKVI